MTIFFAPSKSGFRNHVIVTADAALRRRLVDAFGVGLIGGFLFETRAKSLEEAVENRRENWGTIYDPRLADPGAHCFPGTKENQLILVFYTDAPPLPFYDELTDLGAHVDAYGVYTQGKGWRGDTGYRWVDGLLETFDAETDPRGKGRFGWVQ